MGDFRKGLIVSDNPRLTEEVLSIASKFDLPLSYSYTSHSRTGDEMKSLGADHINVSSTEFFTYVENNFDFILSIHCRQIFPEPILEKADCFNLHPGLNPYNKGWYPQVFSIINKLPVGATLHRMTKDIDAGAVIKQVQVDLMPSDTSFELYERILQAEVSILWEALPVLAGKGFNDQGFEVSEGNYNSKQDFQKLCELNLNSVGTLGEHLDLLRALSHNQFQNAYFCDENGKRTFVSLRINGD
jgi:methionyl-tRNA formyltransferase